MESGRLRGYFFPQRLQPPSSLGPRIPSSSGPELYSKASLGLFPKSLLDPRVCPKNGCSWEKRDWKVDMQAEVSTHKSVKDGSWGGKGRGHIRTLDVPMLPHSHMKLQGLHYILHFTTILHCNLNFQIVLKMYLFRSDEVGGLIYNI